MSECTYSDQLGSRSRRPFLLFVTGKGEVVRFRGESLPGVAVVVGTDYSRNGKWSATTYRLEVAEGVRAISGREGWETGRFTEGLRTAVNFDQPIDRWEDVASSLGVTVAEAMRLLREWRPKESADLDAVEERLAALDDAADESGHETEIISVSFGAPTRRRMREGFWEWPVRIIRVEDPSDPFSEEIEEVGRVEADPDKGWYEPVASGLVTVVSVERSSGHHGGYVSMRLSVPAGCLSEHKAP